MYITLNNSDRIQTPTKRKNYSQTSLSDLITRFPEIQLASLSSEVAYEVLGGVSSALKLKFEYIDDFKSTSFASYHKVADCKNLRENFDGLLFSNLEENIGIENKKEFREWFKKCIPWDSWDDLKLVTKKIEEKYQFKPEVAKVSLPNSGHVFYDDIPVSKILQIINSSIRNLDTNYRVRLSGDAVQDQYANWNSRQKVDINKRILIKYLGIYIAIKNSDVDYQSDATVLSISGLQECPVCRVQKVNQSAAGILFDILFSSTVEDAKRLYKLFDKLIKKIYKFAERVDLDSLLIIRKSEEYLKYAGFVKVIDRYDDLGYCAEYTDDDGHVIFIPVDANKIKLQYEQIIGTTFFAGITYDVINKDFSGVLFPFTPNSPSIIIGCKVHEKFSLDEL